jgi:Tol biopolymer transport system component
MHLEISTPAATDEASFALSPDGQQLVFVSTADGRSRLWLRPLGATSAQPLAGTDGAQQPFWSPDSRSIGFFAAGELKRLNISGGQPQTLTDAEPRHGTWNAAGVILFARTAGGPLFQIAASGGEAAPVTKLADRQLSHCFPYFLPDGRREGRHCSGALTGADPPGAAGTPRARFRPSRNGA